MTDNKNKNKRIPATNPTYYIVEKNKVLFYEIIRMTYEELIKQVQTHTFWEKAQLQKILFVYVEKNQEKMLKKLISDNVIVQRDNVYFVL